MGQLFQWILCVTRRGHKMVFWMNLYGDQINYWSARSLFKCDKCGHIEKSYELQDEETP